MPKEGACSKTTAARATTLGRWANGLLPTTRWPSLICADQAYLTGKEYRQIIMFLRRWDNVGPPTPPVAPSPKRLIFSQPISEPSKETQPVVSAPPPPSGEGPFQPRGDAEPPQAGPSGAGNIPPPRPASALPNPIERPGSIAPE